MSADPHDATHDATHGASHDAAHDAATPIVGAALVRLGASDPHRARERLAELRRSVFASDDATEGARAFVEKRRPEWRGR